MKLLIAVSDHPFDEASFDVLLPLAKENDVALLHVGETPTAVMEALAPRLREAGARVTTLVAPGDPAKTIVARAKAEKADLVVVRASDRHPGLLRRVFGDTVERVVETAGCAVLALRGRHGPNGDRVLLAAGRPSSRMLDVTADVALATRSPVSVVHVEPAEDDHPLMGSDYFEENRGGGQSTQQQAASMYNLQRNAERLAQRGVAVDTRVREGLVETELAAEANSGSYWLTVVRARPVGLLHRMLLGHSFAEDLVRHVQTSVLILR